VLDTALAINHKCGISTFSNYYQTIDVLIPYLRACGALFDNGIQAISFADSRGG